MLTTYTPHADHVPIFCSMARAHLKRQEAWQLKVPRAKTKFSMSTLAHMLTFSFRTSAFMYFYSFYFNACMFPMPNKLKTYNKITQIEKYCTRLPHSFFLFTTFFMPLFVHNTHLHPHIQVLAHKKGAHLTIAPVCLYMSQLSV